MTTFYEARETVYQAWNTGWGTRTSFHLEGHRFDEPAPNTAWARVVVRNLGGVTETLGDRTEKKHRRNGLVIISIFTPAVQGMKTGDEHAQFALDIFESRSIATPDGDDRLDFIAGTVNEVPLGDDEKSRQINVEIPFDFTQKR